MLFGPGSQPTLPVVSHLGLLAVQFAPILVPHSPLLWSFFGLFWLIRSVFATCRVSRQPHNRHNLGLEHVSKCHRLPRSDAGEIPFLPTCDLFFGLLVPKRLNCIGSWDVQCVQTAQIGLKACVPNCPGVPVGENGFGRGLPFFRLC